MIEAWSPPQVYAAEAALMATLPDGALMGRAVDGLLEVTRARIKERRAARIVGLVGTGNNGADTLFALAYLAADGLPVAAAVTERIHPGAHQAAVAAGVLLLSGEAAVAAVADADLVLDGVLGIGGRPEVPDFARAWVEAIASEAYVIAVDIPTGADPDGRAGDPDGVFADETVTFSVLKPVHLLPATHARAGRLTVVDIGLDMDTAATVCRLEHDDVARLWPVPGPGDDKYSRGVLGVIAGSHDYPGAAVLTVTAAVEAGAGLVRYVGPAGQSGPSGLVAAAAPEAVPGAGRVQAWVIGPGLVVADDSGADRLDPRQREAITAALSADAPMLLDAGGLDLLAADLGMRIGLPTLLTPHAGECARLLGVDRAEVSNDPVAHARELAERTGATVLLKGSTTVVVPPSTHPGPTYSQADAPSWLATAGAGDVLAGLIGALLAAGVPLAPAGALGALVHGVAAAELNPGGPIRALSLARALPGTVSRLLLRASR